MAAMLTIPARTKPRQCASCGQRIFWINHPSSGRPHPVSVKHEDAMEPTMLDDGKGISHFADCAFANLHRRTS
jgi:hypothetical protein